MIKILTSIAISLSLIGCASVVPGPDEMAQEARQIKSPSNSAALYFCRTWGYLGGGIAIYPRVNGKIVAGLTTKSFTRVEVPPGEYEISLGYSDTTDSDFFKAVQRSPVKMENITTKAGDVHIYWLGVAGSSLFGGVLTIDHFDNKAQAMDCIQESTFVSPRPM